DRLRDRGVAENVVGARWLFHPVWVELREAFRVRDGLTDIPDLVRVHHQLAIADLLADDPRATHVVLDIAADLDLHVRPALIHRFAAERANLFVGVTEPARGRRVRGKAVAAHLVLALAL